MKKLLPFLLLIASAAFAQSTPCVQGAAPVTGGIALYLPFNNQCNYGYYLNQNSIKIAALFPLAKSLGGNGTATPALIAGTNITISGTWPNYTINAAAGTGIWGGITGTLSNQTDLQNALNLKADATALALKAALDSPAFTGNPTAPTQPLGNNSTSIATTAFVLANSTGGGPTAPCGNNGDIQYNNSGNCGGIPATGTGAVARAVNPNISGLTLTDVIGITQCLQGDASGHIGGTGLPCGAGGGGGPASIKSMSSYASAQVALNSITAGQTLLVDGSFTLCNGSLGASNVTINSGYQGGTLQCGTANAPVITISTNGVEVTNLNIRHTISPTAGGDGIVVNGGLTSTNIHHNKIQLNYNGANLGDTSNSRFDKNYIQLNNNDGVHGTPSSSRPVNQWYLDGNLSQKNLGWGYRWEIPAGFTSVLMTGPWISGWNQSFGNALGGFAFIGSAATSSGIGDIWISGAFSSQDNGTGFYFDTGSAGSRNIIMGQIYAEQEGTYAGAAGYSSATQTPTNAGYGIYFTSSCDPTPGPVVNGAVIWEASDSGIRSDCPGTTLNGIQAFKNGLAGSGNSYQRAAVAFRASNSSINGGYFRDSGSNMINGVDISNSADRPGILGVTCDASVATCVKATTDPANGFQSYVGNRRIIDGSGVPGMTCSNGDEYHRYDAGNFSTLYMCKNAAWAAVN